MAATEVGPEAGPPTNGDPGLAAIRASTPLLRLLSSVASVESVQRILISFETMRADVWVLTTSEDLDDNERIFLLEREYRREVGAFPLDLHVVPLSEVDERVLRAGELIFAR